ncbi:hypothetical protein [Candidatus Magnetominusculus xianensis]|uniref:Cytochrome CBB3 n=1 Tax=Candidatus Magnetominusculus xianensis TaxID=1748249 RepID=A0ABR5SEY1_9BACT|nr:hypothetical protein [Candidatus Magnetominusculus xianensis]KWT83680.1 cytochrome CBB3 [Candidatus Magnetominusculus xianensis]MBF0402622.1 hypothetical protein [Nitrospirota bacterium]
MDKEKKFYPDYLVWILSVVIMIVMLTVVLAMSFPKEMGRRISFSAPFSPKPEWFFLWFFEILKYFPGNFAFIGAVVLPILFIVTLIMIPFTDTGRYGRLKAAVAIGLIYFAFILFTVLPALDY